MRAKSEPPGTEGRIVFDSAMTVEKERQQGHLSERMRDEETQLRRKGPMA